VKNLQGVGTCDKSFQDIETSSY